MVLRRIFGPRRDEVTGEWRRLHNEELNDLYSSPNIVRVVKSRRMRWAGHVARMGEERGAYRVLVGKPEEKRPLGRPRRRWVDNIRMDLQEVGCGYVDWIGLAQNRDRWRRLVSAVMNLRVPWNAGNFLTNCKPVSFSRRTLHHGVSKYVCWASSSSDMGSTFLSDSPNLTEVPVPAFRYVIPFCHFLYNHQSNYPPCVSYI